jgi:hypothetical protein
MFDENMGKPLDKTSLEMNLPKYLRRKYLFKKMG